MIARAPLRVSFFGGGTDSPEFVAQHGPGLVLGTAIDRYVEFSAGAFRHPVPLGTGLGSSSAACVAEIGSETTDLSLDDLAWRAWEEERGRGSSVGWQDATLAAHGGLCLMEFRDSETLVHSVTPRRLEELERHLLLLDLRQPRRIDVARATLGEVPRKGRELCLARRTAEEGYKILTGTVSMASFGSMLHSAWMLKRSLSPAISTPAIDESYDRGIHAGAFGGKLCGAGGGGFLMFIVAPELRRSVKAATGLHELEVSINAPGFSISA
jgi:D-glycero-alpha-D-manno-heptose-7-phosphate kinase